MVFNLNVELRSGVAPDVVHVWNSTGTTGSVPTVPTFPQCRIGPRWKTLEYGAGAFTLTSGGQLSHDEAVRMVQNKAFPLSYGKVCFTDQAGKMRDIIFCGYRDQNNDNLKCDRNPAVYR